MMSMDLISACGKSTHHAHEPQGLKHFSELETISSGGYGIVFRGKHVIDAQSYAIKMIPIQLPESGEFTESDAMSNPFIVSKLREIRYLAKLTHPHIVRYHTSWMDICKTREDLDELLEVTIPDGHSDLSFECFSDTSDTSETDDASQNENTEPQSIVSVARESGLCPRVYNPTLLLYIQMEDMEYTLTEWIEFETPPLHIQYRVLLGLLDGILYLHEADPPIIHCDIKPKNILLCRDGDEWVAKLADFGLVSVLHGPWRPDTDEGTYLYKAPELSNNDLSVPLTPAADIYSLGVLLYECSLQAKTQMECIQRLEQLKCGSPKDLKLPPILAEMLDPNPLKRPTISQVKHYIEEIGKGLA